MFETSDFRNRSTLASAVSLIEVIYHNSVRSVRRSHNNAFMSILVNLFQTASFVVVFYFMFSVLGLRGMAIRGDFMVYIMTGIFLFMVHVKTMGAVAGSEGPASAMMQHAPMSTAVAIVSAMLSQLYINVLSMIVIMFCYHVAVTPFEIMDVGGVLMMILLSWFTGAAVGMVFLSLKPWFPTFVGMATTIYQRMNMIASGKMFVANSLPPTMLAMFSWNPLFHTIDQSRGYAFVNYFPRNTNWEYALWVGIILFSIGLMGEFFTRKHASKSWGARR